MKILYENLRQKEVRLKTENQEDLWYLSYIIEPGDYVSSRTLRKIKIGESSERDTTVIKKPVFLKINVEKVEFHKYATILRVSGKIAEGAEDIPAGSYHTINIEEDTEFSLVKPEFLKYQVDKLREAAESKVSNILIVVFDREEAYFAMLKKYGYEVLSVMRGDVSKKERTNIVMRDFFTEVADAIREYDGRYNFTNIVVGSPAFWKDYLMEGIKDDNLRKRIIPATCSSVGENGISEVIRRQEVRRALQESRVSHEMHLVESLLSEISTEGKAAYGMEETRNAVQAGAVSELLITDGLIHRKRQEGVFRELDSLMRDTEKTGGSVNIISSEHEGGQKLDGLGGIAGILRYRLSY